MREIYLLFIEMCYSVRYSESQVWWERERERERKEVFVRGGGTEMQMYEMDEHEAMCGDHQRCEE